MTDLPMGFGPVVELSILMPCLNEAETLEVCIRKAQAYLANSNVRGEVVIGDNGSTDGSQAIARRCGARVIDIPTRGYGAALYGAIEAARGKYCIMGDADDSYDFLNLDAYLTKLRAGYDLVMGNRFAGEIKPGAMPWKNRYIGNPVLTAIGRTLFSSSIRDFHCGLRGFSKAAFERMDLRTSGMEFASEMVIKATLLEMKMTEVPTILSPDGRSRPPHLLPWRDGWRHLRFMLLFSPNWLFLYPGLIAILIGLCVGGSIVSGPVVISQVHLGLDTLIYCGVLIVGGFQAVIFSLLSRVHAVQEGLFPPNLAKGISNRISLESGLLFGFSLLLAGIALGLYAFLSWSHRGFGELVAEHIARLVIPSSVAMTLGIETILSSFLMSSIALGVRRATTAPLVRSQSASVA